MSPSVGAVVGNVNLAGTQFAATIKIQPHRREHIVSMAETVRVRIMQFFYSTNKQPKRIIVYRDGVSEGEFIRVMNEEMESIRKGCESLSTDYNPKITYIVVQKRHHTRFFCENVRADAVGKGQNIPPGTVVDINVTHPRDFDFYLCSHNGIQGTSRPTHYYVLHDDSGFSADTLQQLTYKLCHLYGRCTRVVSIPAPVYYADLSATRARYHIRSKCNLIETTGSGDQQQQQQPGSSASEQELEAAVVINDNILNRMYFS